MLRYTKGVAPSCLTTIQSTPGADYLSLHGDDKSHARSALIRDQASLCAYCQRRIIADEKKMKVEHWLARATGTGQLTWAHWLGVCLGVTKIGDNEYRHCDTSRGTTPLFLHPVDGEGPNPRDFIEYTGSGEAKSKDNRVTEDIATLNLNAYFLRRGRTAVLEQIRVLLIREGFTTQSIRKQLDRHRLDSGTTAPEYTEFVRYYLSRWLRKQGK